MLLPYEIIFFFFFFASLGRFGMVLWLIPFSCHLFESILDQMCTNRRGMYIYIYCDESSPRCLLNIVLIYYG